MPAFGQCCQRSLPFVRILVSSRRFALPSCVALLPVLDASAQKAKMDKQADGVGLALVKSLVKNRI